MCWGDTSGMVFESNSNSTYFVLSLFLLCPNYSYGNFLKSGIYHLQNNTFHALWPGFLFPWIVVPSDLKWGEVLAVLRQTKAKHFRTCKSWGHQEEGQPEWPGKLTCIVCLDKQCYYGNKRAWDVILMGSLWKMLRKGVIEPTLVFFFFFEPTLF